MSQSFVLCSLPSASSEASSSGSSLPAALSLHLLPFSLGPNSSPYKSTSSPISDYFQPRPCPADTPGIAAGTPIASFRGRQVVGQTISVPKGYRGVIMRTSEAPTLVSSSHASEEFGKEGRGRVTRGKWPLTPASSAASAASASTASVSTISEDGAESIGTRSSPRKVGWMTRVKGAGQIALSRPKTRTAAPTTKKRKFRLDSDDEEDGTAPPSAAGPAGEVDGEDESASTSRASGSTSTPSKRLRGSQSTPAVPMSPDGPPAGGLPAITLQLPTPRKDPGPPRIRRLPRGARSADYVIPGAEELPGPSKDDIPPRSSSLRALSSVASEATLKDGDADVEMGGVGGGVEMKREESVIPSPATENDPPQFDVPSTPAPPKAKMEERQSAKEEQERAHEEEWAVGLGSHRRLKAISTFDGFTLWTPDMPLAGFVVDASATPNAEAGAVANGEVKPEEKVDGAGAEAAAPTEAGVNLRAGWWPTGGAGEGGDEFVRAMGEYLGLLEVLNKPVYLDGMDDKDDESDDDI